MSFIDCFRHQFAGLLASLPVYLPQEAVSGEYEASQFAVLIGGGSGEHPAAIIDTAAAVASVIDDYLDELECKPCEGEGFRGEAINGPLACQACHGTGLVTFDEFAQSDPRSYRPGATVLADRLEREGFGSTGHMARLRDMALALVNGDYERFRSAGDFSWWGGDSWARVVSEASRNPLGPAYDPSKHHSIENWLVCCVGEYVLVSASERVLTDPTVALSVEERKLFAAVQAYAAHRGLFSGVHQYPSGYLLGGRGEQLNDPNMRH